MDILNKDKASRKVISRQTMLRGNKFMENNIMTKKAWQQRGEK